MHTRETERERGRERERAPASGWILPTGALRPFASQRDRIVLRRFPEDLIPMIGHFRSYWLKLGSDLPSGNSIVVLQIPRKGQHRIRLPLIKYLPNPLLAPKNLIFGPHWLHHSSDRKFRGAYEYLGWTSAHDAIYNRSLTLQRFEQTPIGPCSKLSSLSCRWSGQELPEEPTQVQRLRYGFAGYNMLCQSCGCWLSRLPHATQIKTVQLDCL